MLYFVTSPCLILNEKIMGKGDKKTKRGKIISGSYGVLRPKNKASTKLVTKPKLETPIEAAAEATQKPVAKKTTAKKALTKTTEA